MNVWIQNLDFSTAVDESDVSLGRVWDLYTAFDWKLALSRHNNPAHSEDDVCRPGLGLVRQDGSIFHTMPDEPGPSFIIWHPPPKPYFFGLFKRNSGLRFFDIAEEMTLTALEYFFQSEDNQMVEFLEGVSQ